MRHVRFRPSLCQADTRWMFLVGLLLLPHPAAAQGRTTLHFGYSREWMDDRPDLAFGGGTSGLGVRLGRRLELQTAIASRSTTYQGDPTRITSLELGLMVGRFGQRLEAGLGAGVGGWYRSEYDNADAGGLGYLKATVRVWPSLHVGLVAEGLLRSLWQDRSGSGSSQVLLLGLVLRPGR